MSLEIVRRIRGNVHGTIDVTQVEDAVISHEYVQRLRRIKQLAFLHYVFPGATHTRFEHSLGVMTLAGVAWDKLKVNQRRLAETAQNISDFASKERSHDSQTCHGLLAPTFTLMNQVFDSDYHLQVLRLAGLLHDIGHPPFSHSGERFLPSWQKVLDQNPTAPEYLKEWMQKKITDLKSRGINPEEQHVRHEVYSLLLIDLILRETYRSHPHLRIEIDPRDVVSVINPEIKPSANSPLLANGLFVMLHELIAEELDIDRMDYLLRDSRECGVVYGIFDAGRILDGLCIYQDPQDKGLHVAIAQSGMAAFEDYLRARQSMYLQVYFHKTSASAEAMMQALAKKLGGWHLPADACGFADFDEYNIGDRLLAEARHKLKDPLEYKNFEQLLRDLFYRRRLWKRIFETTSISDDTSAAERLFHIRDLIAGEGIEFEHVSSLTSLTRFRPRGHQERSRNYLRVIVKEDFQPPRVAAIEDYTTVIDQNTRIMIHRLYANVDQEKKAWLLKKLQTSIVNT